MSKSEWKSSEQEVVKEIMNTDVYVKIISDRCGQEEMHEDILASIEKFREFERKMSRFNPESELSVFNASQGGKISQELFFLLERCKKYFLYTDGVFDPTILPALIWEGYGEGIGKSKRVRQSKAHYSYTDVVFDEKDGYSAKKPEDVQIDLGGVGKGYIVDQVARSLTRKYKHVFVYAGGDIAACGADRENGYDFWACDVEDPMHDDKTVATLLLRDRAVATSGVNRRKWHVQGIEKHHLIDPKTGKSAETDCVSVTVVASSAEEADVLAKTCCILGLAKGVQWAEERSIAALFVDKLGNVQYTSHIKTYLWTK